MKLLQALFLFLSIFYFAQEKEIDILKEDYKRVKNAYEDYRDEINLPNKYFYYHLKNKKENYFIYLSKKKYDSLLFLKLSDSIIINKSIYRVRNRDSEYYFYSYNDPQEHYYVKYQNSKIIEKSELNDVTDFFRKEDYYNLTLQEYSFTPKNTSPNLYKYQKFSSYPFDLSKNILYQKIILSDGRVKIYDYNKDFPISDEEFLKKIPAIFAEQSVELLKDGKKLKNFNKSTAKNIAMHMLGAITKARDDYKYNYKYELKKGYSEDDPSKPVYSFIFYTPTDQFWGLTIDPKTEKLINIDYGKGMIY